MHVLAPTVLARAFDRERLTPSQKTAIDAALAAHDSNPIVLIEGAPGMGKSAVLKTMHAHTGGKFLTANDVLRMHARSSAAEYEQVVYSVIHTALESNDIVYYDNVGDFQNASHAANYYRPEIFDAVFKSLYDMTALEGKKFVCTARSGSMAAVPGEMIRYRPVTISLGDLKQPDYEHIFAELLGDAGVAAIDFGKIFHHARKLSGYFLSTVCALLKVRGLARPGTQDVIDVLDQQLLKSNVQVREVEEIDLGQLHGVDGIIEKLDRTILLPLNEPDLARELGLEPKHGVILHGPPGTGKTTIGRALAHRMKGKFFLIDGDFDHQSAAFFAEVQAVFAAAQRNAPSVIFIDDADVILTDPQLGYFGRYLLTQLDGLMNEASGRVCVMMTAMDLRGLPPALLRSGRMEVWLEMKLPDAQARSGIIQSYVDRLPIEPPSIDMAALSGKTDGFTPADLRRLVADATGHLALDRHMGDEVLPFEAYLDRAAGALYDQKQLAEHAFHRRGGSQYH